MAPGAKYFKVEDEEDADDQQSLLQLSPRVRVSNGDVQRQREEDLGSPWTSGCIVRMVFLFAVAMMAIGFMIRYLPEGMHGGHDHHGVEIPHKQEEEHHHIFKKAAVAAGQLECSTVGKNILFAGGNAVDAAIATTLCQGVVEPYYSGIGGGAIMTIYNATTKAVTCITSRENAPAAATRDMYLNEDGNIYGPKFIGVPGELRGLEYAYKMYGGKLKWADLFEPAITKARDGFNVGIQMESKLQELYDAYISQHKDSYFCELYCNADKSGVKKRGEIVRNPKLAETLTKVQIGGADAFYQGDVANLMIKDIQELGSIMTLEDLQSYNVTESPAIRIKLKNAGYTIHAPPLPIGGGAVLGAILSVIDRFNVTPADYKQNPNLQWHRTDEAFRHAYGVRYHMGDPIEVPNSERIIQKIISGAFATEVKKKIFDDKTFHDPKYYGATFYNSGKSSTSHVSVLAPNKDAVSITSTVNYHFGAQVISPSTGVVFNNEMDDFSYPTGDPDHDAHLSPANQIQGGKRPLSSMTPSIFLNEEKDPVFIIGAAGGIRIPTAVAGVMLRLLYFGTEDFDEPIRAKRLHDSLIPDQLEYEDGFDSDIVKNLKKIGHITVRMTSTSHVNGIKYHTSHIHAFSDLRNPGAGVDGW